MSNKRSPLRERLGQTAPFAGGLLLWCVAACSNADKANEVTPPELVASATNAATQPLGSVPSPLAAASNAPKRCHPEWAPSDPHPVLEHPTRPTETPSVQALDPKKAIGDATATQAAMRPFSAAAPEPVSTETVHRYENYAAQLRAHATEFKSLTDSERRERVAQLKAKIVLGGAP